MTAKTFLCRAARLARAAVLVLAAAYGAEIKVMTSGAFTAAYLELKTQFEEATGAKVITLTTSMGTGVNSIPKRLERGEAADVVIVDDTTLDRLIAEGRVVAGSKVQLARSAIGIAVRAGSPKPDISSEDALKRTLLHAGSIAYSASISGDYLSTELFPRLGIVRELAAKSKRIEGERVGAVVARGEAEIGFQQISELLPIPGIDYVGPLPSSAQKITVFSGGVAAGSANREAATRFVTFLASHEAIRAIEKSGLEPISNALETARTFHLLEATIEDIQAALGSGRTTCRELVGLYLKRIAAYDKAGPSLNAVAAVNARALQEAERLDTAFRTSGPVGALHCIPVLVKDQLETTDMPTTYGSAVFKDFISHRDATVVARLRSAGAILIGKGTMGEFASGIAGSAAGPIRNAYDPRRHASGSSGGTGSGVAANFAAVGIGEDTGGSIRGPAAVSSLVGLRPTLPLVSRFGMLPARPTTDTIGPIARTVKDAAVVLDAIAGYDPKDPVTAYAVGHIPRSFTSELARDGLRGARIGVILQPMDAKTDVKSDDYRKVKAVIDQALDELKTLGAELIGPITIPDVIDDLNKTYDGNVFETEPAIDSYLAQLVNPPVATFREILLSGKVLPARARVLLKSVGKSTDDAGYAQVSRIAERLRRTVLTTMADQSLNALVYATFDHQPVLIPSDVMTRLVADDDRLGNNRRLSPVLGFPSITVPAGFTTDGVPVGIEFMARPFDEVLLFKFAYAYEQRTHHRRPPDATPSLPGEP